MKVSELRQLSEKKLVAKLVETERELAVSKFHMHTGKEQNSANVGALSRRVAQIKTILHNEVK